MTTMTKERNDIIVEAFEVLVNHLLYIRNVYPEQIFRKRQMYNAVVYTSIYKPLNAYIKGVLSAARDLLASNDLKCLELEMYDAENDAIYEQYKLEIKNAAMELTTAHENAQERDEYLLEFEEELRLCLYKSGERLNTLNTKLPKSARFRINLYTNELAYMRLHHNPKQQDFMWSKHPKTMGRESKDTDRMTNLIALLPLATVKQIGLSVRGHIMQQQMEHPS